MTYLILPNEEAAVARSGAGWFEDMKDKNQDKRLWQALVGKVPVRYHQTRVERLGMER
jgi:hypothetical protein